ncbi:hypothetical protein [Streptomyces sp. NPDC092129]|uniref:hypothetical protein n=1 Tax=Streptomyces sp. NPDC092129 TaxID=3366010 RepID=UPI0037FA7235
MARRKAIVYPPSEHGGRLVRVDGVIVCRAYSMQDLSLFLCRAGFQVLTEVDLAAEDPIDADGELIEWRGGGPDVWD